MSFTHAVYYLWNIHKLVPRLAANIMPIEEAEAESAEEISYKKNRDLASMPPKMRETPRMTSSLRPAGGSSLPSFPS